MADGNFDVLRSPIGDEAWARRYTPTRAGEALDLFQALAALPGAHAAFSMARYQIGRMNYVLRDSPRTQCEPARRVHAGARPSLAWWCRSHLARMDPGLTTPAPWRHGLPYMRKDGRRCVRRRQDPVARAGRRAMAAPPTGGGPGAAGSAGAARP